MLRLEGIIYKTFANYVVLRGFAEISDLAAINHRENWGEKYAGKCPEKRKVARKVARKRPENNSSMCGLRECLL